MYIMSKYRRPNNDHKKIQRTDIISTLNRHRLQWKCPRNKPCQPYLLQTDVYK